MRTVVFTILSLLTKMWNYLFKIAYDEDYDYFYQTGDDINFKTKGWVNCSINILKQKDTKDLLITRDELIKNTTSSFFFRKISWGHSSFYLQVPTNFDFCFTANPIFATKEFCGNPIFPLYRNLVYRVTITQTCAAATKPTKPTTLTR